MAGFKKPWERDGAPRPPRKGGFKKPWDRGSEAGPGGRAPSRPPRAGFRKPWDRDAEDSPDGRAPSRPTRSGFRKPWEARGEGEGGEERGDRPFRPARRSEGFRGSFRRDKPWEDRGSPDGQAPSWPKRGSFRKPGFRKPWEDRDRDDAPKPWALPRKDRSEGSPEGRAPSRPKRAAPIPVEGGELVYGRQPVREILRAARRPVKLVVLADGVKDSDEVSDIRELCEKAGIQIGKYRREDLDAWVNEANHQGVVAFCEEYPYAEVDEIADALDKADGDAVVVVLDHVQDPQNLGSILRTCECAGVLGVVLPVDRAVGVTPAAVRASAGAAEHLKIARLPNLASALERFKGAGAWITGLEASDDARPYASIDYKGKTVLVVGSEGNGICSPVRAKCDFFAKLPLLGKVNSLNAGVAAAIALYEILRQHAAAAAPAAGETPEPAV